MMDWLRAQRPKNILLAGLGLLVMALFYVARRALLPFVLGTALAYILLPLIDVINAFLPPRYRHNALVRALTVLAVYLLVLAVIVALLAFVIPPIATQIEFLIQRLPSFAKKLYEAAPAFVQQWLDRYQAVPENIQAALQRGMESLLQTLITAVQTGVTKSVSLVFSTLSFVLGLVVVPLWMFFLLRDQPHLQEWFYRVLPLGLRDDASSVVKIVDNALSAYLRGRLLLGLSMAIMGTAGLILLGLDFALLLGTVMGVFEIVPLVGPILGAIPVLVVTLATSPSNLPWVLLLIVAAQQIVDYVLVPLVARDTVRLHPALVMLVIVVGSDVAGVWGVVLSVPMTAIVRDVARYLVLRVSETPLQPGDALGRVMARNGGG